MAPRDGEEAADHEHRRQGPVGLDPIPLAEFFGRAAFERSSYFRG